MHNTYPMIAYQPPLDNYEKEEREMRQVLTTEPQPQCACCTCMGLGPDASQCPCFYGDFHADSEWCQHHRRP